MKAILHIDGDSFFVSCELTRRPGLKGKPVVTGEERGIATAVNPAAKKLGVVRGMRTREIRKRFPSVVILPSDYVMYAQYARRMYDIVGRYTDRVEEYSVDECFADLTGLVGGDSKALNGMSYPTYEALVRAIQMDLYRSLGITFSVGLSVNKVMAKVASKWNKPFGVTIIPSGSIKTFLKGLPVGKIWGIGSATTVYLRKLGVTNALELAEKSRAWVAEHCDRPLAEIYEEFQGNYIKKLEIGAGKSVGFGGLHLEAAADSNANSSADQHRIPGSIQHTRTFYPPSRDKAFLWSQISLHIESACAKLRGKGLVAKRASFFLKTSGFEYIRAEAVLPDPTAVPQEVLKAIEPVFEGLWKKVSSDSNVNPHALLFRAAGIGLSDLHVEQGDSQTRSLFEAPVNVNRSRLIRKTVDRLARRYGKHAVFLGSSFKALKADGDLTKEGKARPFDVIYLGRSGKALLHHRPEQ